MTSCDIPRPHVPAIGDSRSQVPQSSHVVKDSGRELGEGVTLKISVDSPPAT